MRPPSDRGFPRCRRVKNRVWPARNIEAYSRENGRIVALNVGAGRTSASRRFASFSTSLEFGRIPKPVVDAALYQLLDTYGCALAAQGMHISTEAAAAMSEYGGLEQATAIGIPNALPAPHAALVNGCL